MNAKLSKLTSVMFAGAAAAAIVAAPVAMADPAPPPCAPDGTNCPPDVAGPNGAVGAIPGGPIGAAGPEGAAGSVPGGVFGQAGPGGASGCVPGYCTFIPAPPPPQ